MRFCGPNFRKTTLIATVYSSSPHCVHAAELVFFHVLGITLWTHAGVLHEFIFTINHIVLS